MLQRTLLGATVLALVAGTGLYAGAEPIPRHTATGGGRHSRLEIATLGKISNLPQALRPDTTVSALVQLSSEPVAVREQEAAGTFNKAAAERQVKASQDAVLPELTAAGARSYGRLKTVLNAVQVRVKVSDLADVAAVEGVKAVQVSRVVHLENAAAERFTGVDQTWQDLGLTGRGQVIGVIDSGLDYTHAGFGGPGTTAAFRGNNGTVIEPGSFPTAKVVGGFDFVGDAYDAESSTAATPRPDPDPLDCGGHGSHVAGTAAGSGVLSNGTTYRGPYNRATLSKSFVVPPGVAPQAKLRAYRVFGCDGAANDDVIIAAIDRATADGVNVINMSLGSSFGTANDLQTQAIETATAAGVLVVTSAGNSGSSAYLVDTPSTSDTALSVAAIDASRPTFPAVSITGGVTATGMVANGAAIPAAITAGLVDLGLGCDAAAYTAAAGKIAVTTRGICDRVARAEFGQAAGARAVIMVNNEPGLPPFEGTIPGVTIPFIGVDGARAGAFQNVNGKTATISATAPIPNPAFGKAADFSSNGPRRLDSAQKPDLAAPGVSIASVASGTGTGSIQISGTSMASPHTAGVAALVRQAHPRWSPLQAKAAIMSTAAPEKIGDFDSRRLGTGLVQPRRATATQAYAWTPSGLNSLRFGAREIADRLRATRSFQITNRSNRSITYDLSTRLSSARLGAEITISPRSLTVPAGRTRSVSVSIRLDRDDIARLPDATASDGGELISLHGLVVATPRSSRLGVLPLTMSFLSVPVAVSDIQVVKPVKLRGGSQGTIEVRNRGAHSGTADVYSWLLSDPAGDATDPEVADLTDVGVQALPGTAVGASASDRLLVFAASQARSTSTQATREVDLLLDTTGDGEADFLTFATDTGLATSGVPDGTVTAFTIDTNGVVVDAWEATAPANGSTIELPVLASAIKSTARNGRIGVQAVGFSLVANGSDQVLGTATFNPFQPAVSSGNFVTVQPGRSAKIPVEVDRAQLSQQTARGWLVVSLDDRSGRRETDRVRLPVPVSRLTPTTR
ncbi:MAG TPA: S8 family serine peptidase [Propionibacteriaceae bacterium]|nr:S8 family serine peptidase [Propionibacteriaceae bacterium]